MSQRDSTLCLLSFSLLIYSVDNSEYMRNGDFLPTRLQAQQDAVNIVCHSKTRSNPENNVGLITLAKYMDRVGGGLVGGSGVSDMWPALSRLLSISGFHKAAFAYHLPRLPCSLFSININSNLFLIFTQI